MLIATFLAGVLIPFAGSLAGPRGEHPPAPRSAASSASPRTPSSRKSTSAPTPAASASSPAAAIRSSPSSTASPPRSSTPSPPRSRSAPMPPASPSSRATARSSSPWSTARRSEAYDRVDAPTFSPDSARFAYAAARGTRRYLVLDGARGGEYDSLTPPFVFSPDQPPPRVSSPAAAAASSSSTRARPDGSFDIVLSPLSFSPDSRRLGYVGVEGEEGIRLRRRHPGDRVRPHGPSPSRSAPTPTGSATSSARAARNSPCSTG